MTFSIHSTSLNIGLNKKDVYKFEKKTLSQVSCSKRVGLNVHKFE